MTDSLVPLVELYGQTDNFILCYVERLHHFPRFQHTILCVEVPSPFHLICGKATRIVKLKSMTKI